MANEHVLKNDRIELGGQIGAPDSPKRCLTIGTPRTKFYQRSNNLETNDVHFQCYYNHRQTVEHYSE